MKETNGGDGYHPGETSGTLISEKRYFEHLGYRCTVTVHEWRQHRGTMSRFVSCIGRHDTHSTLRYQTRYPIEDGFWASISRIFHREYSDLDQQIEITINDFVEMIEDNITDTITTDAEVENGFERAGL